MAQVLISLPSQISAEQVIAITCMIAHPMETGMRAGSDGKTVVRNIITKFSCSYLGVPVFSAQMFPSTAANPFISFHLRASRSGPIEFIWEGDHGFKQTEVRQINVG